MPVERPADARGSRRAHRKSRTGCTECKRRRVKCGEERPSCNLCIRFGVQCVYAPAQSSVAAPSPAAYASSSSAPRDLTPGTTNHSPEDISHALVVSRPTSPWPTSATSDLQYDNDGDGLKFDLKDIILFHQWCTSTSLSIVHSHEGSHIWQTSLTEIAIRHRYVLYALLGVASLHLAHINPSEEKNRAADAAAYHNIAIQGFREALNSIFTDRGSEITPEREDKDSAIFILTMLNVPYVFAMYGRFHDNGDSTTEQKSARISRTLGEDWIPIMRGVHVLLEPVVNTLRHGVLKPIFTLPGWQGFELGEAALNAEDERFLRLRQTWANNNEADSATYNESLYVLRRVCAWGDRFIHRRALAGVTPAEYNHEWSVPFMWIQLAPERLFVLLQQRQPPALLLFAHFGALLHELDHYWWVQGWGRSIVEAVDELLGSYWQPWLEGPKQAIAAT